MENNNGKAFKNQSMLEDSKLNDVEKTLKKFKTKYLDGCGAPIGHVYSFMLERLIEQNPDSSELKHPNLQGFIDEINEGLLSVGDGFAQIRSPLDRFYSRYSYHLVSLLDKRIENGELEKESANLIFKEAQGGHLYSGTPYH